MTRKYDAVIVGARCAGAATAMLLARAGLHVLVVDHDEPDRDTMSTHALMRTGVLQLSRWGLMDEIRAGGTPPVTAAEFIYGAERTRVPIVPVAGSDALYAPRRFVLDGVLAASAARAGAELRYRTSCAGLLRDEHGRVNGIRLGSGSAPAEKVNADLVIGADGRRSTVARLLEAPVLLEARNSSACLFGYYGSIPNRGYRWFWDRGAGGGIIPTNDGLSCIFVSLPDSRAPELRLKQSRELLDTACRILPAMAADLEGADPASALQLFAGQRGRIRQATGPGWALVGDAGYFKDPITAHGITDALRDAEMLARSVTAGKPDEYARIRDSLSADFFRLTDLIAGYDWTLEEARALHQQLNVAMKAEQAWVNNLADPEIRSSKFNVRLAS
ncbi:MAG: NAD(P)/FAD-dependent oxidoreductase [Hyphomonas sp.]|nr:NAD(P)/FAD-dependent oxidoreductase [Hyphomonas sp.]